MNAAPSVWMSLGVPDVINAAGKMTYLGSSSLHPSVTAAMAAAGSSFVDMAQLKSAVGAEIARLADAPAGWVVGSAAAGIVQAVAGSITGTDLGAIEALPDVPADRREVVLCKGHAVHFGAPLTQMLRVAGGLVHEVGAVNRTTTEQLTAALSDRSAAVVYVVSHHASPGAPELAEVIQLAHAVHVPVIVDAAAETDLRRFVAAGADIAIYSGHKAIGGPTSGIVLGSAPLVAACAAQESGVGRAMKVGKETLAGVLTAVDNYVRGRTARTASDLDETLAIAVRHLGSDLPLGIETVRDPTRPIPRLRLTVGSDSPLSAVDIVAALAGGNPSVRTRNHAVESGVIDIDPRELSSTDAEVLAARVRTILAADTHASSKVG